MAGELVYAWSNTLGVNLKAPRDAFFGTPQRGADGKVAWRSQTGTCVGLFAAWCAKVVEGAALAQSKPGILQSHIAQQRWEWVLGGQNNSTRDALPGLVELVRASFGVTAEVIEPAGYAGPDLLAIMASVTTGALMLLAPAHCIAVNRVDGASAGGAASGVNCRFDPNTGLYRYADNGALDADLMNEFNMNPSLSQPANGSWFLLRVTA